MADLDLSPALSTLSDAVGELDGDGYKTDRLQRAAVQLLTLAPGQFPVDLQQRFQSLRQALTRAGELAAIVHQLSPAECESLAAAIKDLYKEVRARAQPDPKRQ